MTERPLHDPLPDNVREAQRRAADPRGSAWVEANAGSGKTRVLTDRVLRLLLSGVAPDQILCLTYTKAAAAEMRGRVSERLARWTLADDTALGRELAEMSGSIADADELRRARTLFAHALETPGGLKIQTIHAFCESVLHRFPVEAGVPFDFAVLEDFEREAMILAAREVVLAEGLHGEGEAGAVETLFALVSDAALTEAIDAALAEARRLKPVLADVAAARRRLRRLVGLRSGETPEAVAAEIVANYPFGVSDHRAVFAVCPPSPGGSRFEDKLASFELVAFDAEALLDIYLTKEGLVPKGFPKKALAQGLPTLAPALLAEAERLAALRLKLTRAELVARSEALLDVLAAITRRYEIAKRARSLLDFDDLIARLGALLRNEALGPWVRYRLDGGISHVLIDESQDTNPEQWAVVDALVEDFFEAGGIERQRTHFGVGDAKQSIFSFQGAEPEQFRQAGRRYALKAMAARGLFIEISLSTSFRTLPGILQAVDVVFASDRLHEAVLADKAIVHHTARRDPGGTVTVWPFVQQAADVSPEQWPIEVPRDTRSAPRQVAERIASEIAGWIMAGRPLAARGRAVRADDVLILVQSRSALFHELIRALHRAGLATPGADRLNVTSHIAVLDLLALGDVLLNPGDDLQLAALLRSPLFAVSEDDLYAVAAGRGGQTLWAALAQSALPSAKAAHGELAGWRSRLDFERPYTFFARVLYAEGGLRRFHQRLGREVDDVMAEFLDLALAHEQAPQPSLQGFLAAMRSREVTIRRELGERGGGVRVMTVHGAKGLEAPVVILADAATRAEGRQTSRAVYLGFTGDGPVLVHAPSRAAHVPETLPFRDAEMERQEDEYWRKLYVAMTRAEDELYLTGPVGVQGRLEGTWYEAVTTALQPLGEVVAEGGETTLVFPRERPPAVAAGGEAPQLPARPLPLVLPPLPLPRLVPVLRPSLEGAPTDPQRALESTAETLRDADAARRDGIALHALLQHLPGIASPDRQRVAAKALGVLLPEAPERHERLAARARSILGRPELAVLFGPGSRGEVPFLARGLRNGAEVTLTGRIDRLVAEGGSMLVVDFKSDASPPVEPEAIGPAYLTQLGLYALVAGQLFPHLRIEAAILWTELESLVKLPDAAVAQAVRGFTIQ